MVYIVRETRQYQDQPEAKGTELKRFKTWEEAKDYSNALFEEKEIKTYISEEQE